MGCCFRIVFLFVSFFLFFTPLANASDYMVVFKDSASLREEVRAMKGGEIDHVYRDVFPGFSLSLTKREVRSFRQDEDVLLVARDARVRASYFRKTKRWNLDRLDQRGLFPNGVIQTSASGLGVDIYVVDSGVTEHRDIMGRIDQGYSLVEDNHGTRDCNNHGTHVASIAAGTRYGVAPGANIIPVRVLDCSGFAYWSEVIAGLDWVAAHHTEDQRAVVNMSLEGNRFAPANIATRALVDAGMVVTVAAGNSWGGACRYSPASEAAAITVGATDKKDLLADYSNLGPCVDIYAPGDLILAADGHNPQGKQILSGTSMASAHVAGAAALVLESCSCRPQFVISLLGKRASKRRIANLGPQSKNKLLYIK